MSSKKLCRQKYVFIVLAPLRVQVMKFERSFLINKEIVRNSHLHKVRSLGECKYVCLESIAEACLFVKINDVTYISKIPYGATVE